MKKYKNVILVVLAFIIIIVGVYYLSKLGENKYFKEISYEKYLQISSKDSIVYVGSKEDEENFNFIKDYAFSNNVEMKYIYTENLTDDEKEYLLGNEEYAIIVNEDNKVSFYNDEISTFGITNYLMSTGSIGRNFMKIGITDFEKLVQTENFVVVIGRTGCHYCEEYQPVLSEVVKKEGINIYYLNLDTISEDDYEILYSKSSYLANSDWGTPTTLIFSNDKEINYLSGLSTYDELTTFLKENKVLS